MKFENALMPRNIKFIINIYDKVIIIYFITVISSGPKETETCMVVTNVESFFF